MAALAAVETWRATAAAHEVRVGLPAAGHEGRMVGAEEARGTRLDDVKVGLRITSYNVCYTKLLRFDGGSHGVGGVHAPAGSGTGAGMVHNILAGGLSYNFV